MNLGKRILEIRKENKLSQEEFSEIFNVTRQTVSSWENSKSYPDIETIIKISDKFDISLDILLKENKDMIANIDKKVKNSNKLKCIILALIILIILIVFLFPSRICNTENEKEKALKQIEYGTEVISFTGETDNFIMNNGKIDFTLENSLIQITDFNLKENTKINSKKITYAVIQVYFDDKFWGMTEYINNEKENFKEWLNNTLLLETVSHPCREKYDSTKCEAGRSTLIDKSLFPDNMKIIIDYDIDSEITSETFEVSIRQHN